MSKNTSNTSSNTTTYIPAGGTLGILAFGYRGIMLWREERLRLQKELNKDSKVN